MKNGPVLSRLYNLIKSKEQDKDAQHLWDCRFATDGYNLVALSDRIPKGKLSRYEKNVLNHIDAQYHDKTFSEMIDLVHRYEICPEWHDPGNASVPIPFKDILRSIGYSEDEIEWAIEENKVFGEEYAHFKTLAEKVS